MVDWVCCAYIYIVPQASDSAFIALLILNSALKQITLWCLAVNPVNFECTAFRIFEFA